MGYNGIPEDLPQGFILNDAGMYSFVCQEVFPDILSFITAIPDQLKPLFLIPIKIETAASHYSSDGMIHIACRIASSHISYETSLDGNSPESDYFGTKTFVYDDLEPTVPKSEPGSIFDIDGADEITHHQEFEVDQNIQNDADTSYMSDVDLTDSGLSYPYRTDERPLRHSSIHSLQLLSLRTSAIVPLRTRMALEPLELETKTPDNIKDNADVCNVSLISYDKESKVFTFNVNCGGSSHTVQSKLNDSEHVALNCSCNFWRWNGPEYSAKTNNYLLGAPSGTASPPDIRDPDREFYLCKHTYAVIARLDQFIDEIKDENWGVTEEQTLDEIDENWDRLEGVAEIDLSEAQENDVEAEVEPEGIELEDDEGDLDSLDENLKVEDLDDSDEEPEEETSEDDEEEIEDSELEPEDETEPEPEPEDDE